MAAASTPVGERLNPGPRREPREQDREPGAAEWTSRPPPCMGSTVRFPQRYGLDSTTLLGGAASFPARGAPYRIAAAMLPPSTVRTAPVVLRARARDTNASATSLAWTSRPSRFPAM